MFYFIHTSKSHGATSYSVNYNKKTVFVSGNYDALVRFLKAQKAYREKIGFAFKMTSASVSLLNALNEDVYSYTY